MATDLDSYITASEAPRVQFGGRETQTMPLEWAAAGLTWLYRERPQVFAEMMTQGILGIERKPGRH